MAENPGVSKKISKLVRDENVPQRQAVAMALSMDRAKRLTRGGGYVRASKKASGRGSSRR